MKSLKYFFIATLLTTLLPASAGATVEINTEARVSAPFENGINIRRLDLKNKLFREEMEERKMQFIEAREDFKNATPDTRNIMRSEFRAKFTERFKFTLDKLTEFQTKIDTRIQAEKSAGVDVSKAEVKLEESKSFMAQIDADIESLKSLLNERYAEDERETKKEEAKILFEKIKSGIKSSHLALKESMKELRAVMISESDTEVEASL